MKKIIILLLLTNTVWADSYWDNHWYTDMFLELGLHDQTSGRGTVGNFSIALNSKKRGHEFNIIFVHASDPNVSSNQLNEKNERGLTRDSLGPEYYYKHYLKEKFYLITGAGVHYEMGAHKSHSSILEAKGGIGFTRDSTDWLLIYTKTKSNGDYNAETLGINLRINF